MSPSVLKEMDLTRRWEIFQDPARFRQRYPTCCHSPRIRQQEKSPLSNTVFDYLSDMQLLGAS